MAKPAKNKIVFGVDEVGRGCLAGPVIACAITLINSKKQEIRNKQFQISNFKIQNRDSKKLNVKQREEIYKFLQADANVVWGIGKVGERMIDKINILQATKLAMVKAVESLEKKIGRRADILLIDGNFSIPIAREQKSIIRGDEKIFLISLASIVAKVERDRLMTKMHQKHPEYGFDKHKGYGTRSHYFAIKQCGICPLHRVSFDLHL